MYRNSINFFISQEQWTKAVIFAVGPTILLPHHPDFSCFASSSSTMQLFRFKISVFDMYCPPSSSTFSKLCSVFSMTLNSFLSFTAATRELIITGDYWLTFTLIITRITSPPMQFLSPSLLSPVNCTQHVNLPTHTSCTSYGQTRHQYYSFTDIKNILHELYFSIK